MFSQLVFVRLRAAESALRNGRLDEAYRLASAADLREHRRGAVVLAELTERFIDRARNHYRADRFAEALMDLERAESGGVLKEQIAELRECVQTVSAEQKRQEQDKQSNIENARRRIEGGSLQAGRRMLEKASQHDPKARQLRDAAERRSEDVVATAEQAEKLIGQRRFAASAERIRRAKKIDSHNERVIRVETRLCNEVINNARMAIKEGRLKRAQDELACLGTLGSAMPAKRELTDLLALARKATQCLQSGQNSEARRHAMSLQRLLPKAAWLKAAIEQLSRLEDAKVSLQAGPLGEEMSSGRSAGEPVAKEERLGDTVALPNRQGSHGSLPDKLLLLVDGGGSYLLLRRDRVSIGRAVAEHPADIPLLSDLHEQHAELSRAEDDYFLISSREIEVGGRPARHHLLRDGDRVVLGRKAKFFFRLPSRKSATAALDLSDTSKMPNDVRRVLLFHRHATIGNGPTAHIRCRHAGPTLVLFERDGAMWIRPQNDGHVDREAKPVRLSEPVEIGGVSLVLEPWKVRIPGSRSI